jgi:hypothetical protein
MNIHWKKGAFSSKYELFNQSEKIGMLKESSFGTTDIGQINDQKIKLKKKGIFSRETAIIDSETNQTIGRIKLSNWKNKALIKLHDKVYLWKSDNFWSTKWSISIDGKPLIKYQSRSFKGEITSQTENDTLILCGLSIISHFTQQVIFIAVIAAIIIAN